MKARVNNEKDRNATHLTRLEKDEITRENILAMASELHPWRFDLGHLSKSVTLWTPLKTCAPFESRFGLVVRHSAAW